MTRELKKPGQFISGCLFTSGALVALMFGLFSIAYIFDDEFQAGVMAVFLFFFGCGAGLAWWGWRRFRRRVRAGKYVEMIANQNQGHVEKIAMLLGMSDIDRVKMEIQMTINEGFLRGYNLNPHTGLITRIDPLAAPDEHLPGPQAFICSSCGARNRVESYGGPLKCEFCGTPHVEVCGRQS